MNADNFKEQWSQFKGELVRQWGQLTDDDLVQIKGNYDIFIGKVRQRYGTHEDDIIAWTDKWYQGNRPTSVEQSPSPTNDR